MQKRGRINDRHYRIHRNGFNGSYPIWYYPLPDEQRFALRPFSQTSQGAQRMKLNEDQQRLADQFKTDLIAPTNEIALYGLSADAEYLAKYDNYAYLVFTEKA